MLSPGAAAPDDRAPLLRRVQSCGGLPRPMRLAPGSALAAEPEPVRLTPRLESLEQARRSFASSQGLLIRRPTTPAATPGASPQGSPLAFARPGTAPAGLLPSLQLPLDDALDSASL